MVDPGIFYSALPTLHTRRLLLRPLTLADAADYFRFASDPNVTRFLRWESHLSPDVTRRYLKTVTEGYVTGSDGPWGIAMHDGGNLIGAIHLMCIEPEHARADIGLVIARGSWRMGLGFEALCAATGCAFERLGLHRLQAFCHSENTAACALFGKAGFVHEGRLRGYECQKGAYTDFHLYAMLRSGWR